MLTYRGYLVSLAYAKERPQGRPLGVRAGPQVPIIVHDDVKHMLLKQKSIAEGGLSLALLGARLLDDEATRGDENLRQAAGQKLALLTPVIKTWTSEMGQEALHLAIQIHGGAGYTRDYLPELLYRDNRLNPIHEGTTGIQAMDLVGRKLRRENGASFMAYAAEVEATISEATISEAAISEAMTTDLKGLAQALSSAWQDLKSAADTLLRFENEADAMRHATAFLHAFGHGVVGHIWLQQALLVQDNLDAQSTDQSNLHQGILMTAHYFIDIELPRVKAWLSPILSPASALETAIAWF